MHLKLFPPAFSTYYMITGFSLISTITVPPMLSFPVYIGYMTYIAGGLYLNWPGPARLRLALCFGLHIDILSQRQASHVGFFSVRVSVHNSGPFLCVPTTPLCNITTPHVTLCPAKIHVLFLLFNVAMVLNGVKHLFRKCTHENKPL